MPKLIAPPRKSPYKIDNEKVYAPIPIAIYFYFILFSFYCANLDNSHCKLGHSALKRIYSHFSTLFLVSFSRNLFANVQVYFAIILNGRNWI